MVVSLVLLTLCVCVCVITLLFLNEIAVFSLSLILSIQLIMWNNQIKVNIQLQECVVFVILSFNLHKCLSVHWQQERLCTVYIILILRISVPFYFKCFFWKMDIKKQILVLPYKHPGTMSAKNAPSPPIKQKTKFGSNV